MGPPGGGRKPVRMAPRQHRHAHGAGQLLDSLLDTITRLNRNRAWPLTILPPRPGDVIVDRGRRTISAICLWKRKPDTTKETK